MTEVRARLYSCKEERMTIYVSVSGARVYRIMTVFFMNYVNDLGLDRKVAILPKIASVDFEILSLSCSEPPPPPPPPPSALTPLL